MELEVYKPDGKSGFMVGFRGWRLPESLEDDAAATGAALAAELTKAGKAVVAMKADLTELRSFKKPPAAVKNVIKAVACALDPKSRAPDDKGIMQIIGKPNAVVQRIKDYEVTSAEALSSKSLARLKVFTGNADLSPEALQKSSRVMIPLMAWVHAVVAVGNLALAEAMAQHAAAVKVQNLARIKNSKKRVAEVREQKGAAIKLQGKQRQRLAKGRVQRIKEEREMNGAARSIQSRVRGRQAKKRVERKRNGVELVYDTDDAPKRAPKKIFALSAASEEDKAAVVIQGKARQRKAKAKVAKRKQEHKGATVLQNKQRQKMAREELRRRKEKRARVEAELNDA